MLTQILLLGMALLLFSEPAAAFPVVLGGISSNIMVAALSLLGLAKKNKTKSLAPIFLLLLGMSAYGFFTTQESRTLALEHEHFVEQVQNQTKRHFHVEAPSKAIEDIKSGNANYIIASGAKSYAVNGHSVVYFKDERYLSLLSKFSGKKIYVFSKYREHALYASQVISNYGQKAIIVDSGYLPLKELLSSSNNISEYKSVIAGYESVYNYFSEKNHVVISDDNQLKTHAYMGASLFTEIDLLMLTDKEWKELSGDNQLPLHISFTKSYDEETMELIANHIRSKMGYENSTHSRSYVKDQAFTILQNDNQITPPHYNSNKRMSVFEVYALPRKHGEITIGCFSLDCMSRIPPNGSGFNAVFIDTLSTFAMKDRKLTVSKIPFDKSLPIVLAAEDSNSSLLSYYLANELVKEGYSFKGFTQSNSELFGASYFVSSRGDYSERMHYDSKIAKALVLAESVMSSITPKDAVSVNNAILIAIGALLGIIATRGPWSLAISATTTLVLTASLSSFMKVDFEEYQYFLVNPLWLTALMLIVLNQSMDIKNLGLGLRGKVILYATLIATSWWTMHFTSTPVDRIYAGLFLSLITINLYKVFKEKARYIPLRLGDKYAKTEPLIDGHKGYIVKPNNKNIPIYARILPSTWIVRSNHTVADEQLSAGIFESRVSKTSDIEFTIKELRESLKGKISEDNVQFWVVKHKAYRLKGVAKSHADEDAFSISYAIGKNDNATEGLDSEYKLFSRNEKKSRLEKSILKLVSKAEQLTNSPVVIEFGVTKLGMVDILQVRKDHELSTRNDEKSLEAWRLSYSDAVEVETIQLSPLSRSIVSYLYGHSVVFNHSAAVRTNTALKPFVYMDAVIAFEELKSINEKIINGDITLSTLGLIELLKDVLAPISNCDTTMPVKGNRRFGELEELIQGIYQYSSKSGIMVSSYEISGKWDEGNINVFASTREVCKSLMLLSLGIIKRHIENKECFDFEMALIPNTLGKAKSPNVENEFESKKWVIVAGAMPEKEISLEDVESMSKEELKSATLVVDTLPGRSMGIIKDLGGLRAAQGSPLCHMAITAKHYNIPCIIG